MRSLQLINIYRNNCFHHHLTRCFTTTLNLYQEPLQQFKMKMQPFAKLNLTSDIPVWIKPLSPHDFPNMDQFILSVWKAVKSNDLNLKEVCEVTVDENDNGLTVQASAEKDAPVFCAIQLPLNADLDVTMRNDIEMSKMESGNLKVFMEKGNCRLNSMKCTEVDIHSVEGDVTSSRALHGDLKVRLEKGNLTADRIQGQDVNVICQNGNVAVKALYAVLSSIRSNHGDVSVSSCHGETRVVQDKGTLTIGSLDGALIGEVKHGDVSVHITRHRNLDLTAHSGDITLTTDQPNSSLVELTAANVDISPEMSLNDEQRSRNGDIVTVKGVLRSESEATIRCTAHKGKITLSFKDWLSTLNLS